jgi:hypothetical protein
MKKMYKLGTVLCREHSLGPHYYIAGPFGIVGTYPLNDSGLAAAHEELEWLNRKKTK